MDDVSKSRTMPFFLYRKPMIRPSLKSWSMPLTSDVGSCGSVTLVWFSKEARVFQMKPGFGCWG